MKGKQVIIGLLIAVTAVFVGVSAQAQSQGQGQGGNLQQARPIDIIVENNTNLNWQASCQLNKGNINSCPNVLNSSTIVTFSFGSSDYSISGDSGNVYLTTQGKKGMVTIQISFNHPYGPDRTSLNAGVVQQDGHVTVSVDTSQLQHHHAIGKVTISTN